MKSLEPSTLPPLGAPSDAPTAWAAYLGRSSDLNNPSSLPHRLLVQIARQGALGDPDCCAVVVALLETSQTVRQLLRLKMGQHDLSETRMATLLSLYAVSPSRCSVMDLADQVGVSRSRMTRILDVLKECRWVQFDVASSTSGSSSARLTEAGRRATTTAVKLFLQQTTQLADPLTASERHLTVTLCDRLRRQASDLNQNSITTFSP